jgi:hypothetical protein
MKCKNKHIAIKGFIQVDNKVIQGNVLAIITNDEIGKTLTLAYGDTEITIPFEAIEKYLI